jgi:hypothetical protein
MTSFNTMVQGIHWWPVIEGAIVYMLLGIFWYSPLLFGPYWVHENKITQEMVDDVSMVYSVLGSALIGFVMSFGVALAVNTYGASDVVSGMLIGFVIAFLFALPPGYSATLWGTKSFKSFLIDAGRMVLFLVITGAILSWWR